MRAEVGLKPTTPQKAAGRITEPTVLRAEGEGAVARRDRRRGAAAGAARGVSGLVRVRRRAGVEVGELGGNRLAQYERAGAAQARDAGGLRAPEQLRWEGRAGPGGEAVDAKDVLQPDQNAEKRRARLRIGVALEERFRLSVEAAAALRLGQQGADGGFEGL